MSIEIPKEKWMQFFKDLSKRRFAWETKIEVKSDGSGKQVLSNGLYLSGVTYQDKAGLREIEISVSKNKKSHQTHSISNPVKISYLSEDKYHDSQLEIEEENGRLTLLRIFNPMPIMVGYAAHHLISVEQKL